MNSNLVPEIRTDKNGKPVKRWVNKAPDASGRDLPAPAYGRESSPLNDMRESALDALTETEHSLNRKIDDKRLINRIADSGRPDARELLEVFRNNAASTYPLGAFETLYEALRHGGADNIPSLIDEAALKDAALVVRSIPGKTPDEFTSEINNMITYTLTSDNREEVIRFALERHFSTLEEMTMFLDSVSRTKKPLQSGVL